MSFLHLIRGFGRSSKNKKKEEPGPLASPLYLHGNVLALALRRSQLPTKSPQKLARYTAPTLPTKRSKPAQQRLPTRRSQVPASPLSQFGQASGAGANGQPLLSLQSQVSKSLQQTSSNKDEPLPLYRCEPFVKTALVKGSYKTIVQLPKYVDIGEWLALNIFEMNAHLNLFYGVVLDYCTAESCPTMLAGPHTNYLWADNNGQAIQLPAPQYIDYVLTWISNKINDQLVFPTKLGGAFPPNFTKDCKNISRQMFRVFAHIYYAHFDTIVHLLVEAHWNSFFAHFISFVKEYNLIERSELEPLLPLIEDFEAQGKIN